MSREIKIRIRNLDAFRRYQKQKAAAKAIELELDDLSKQAGLPTSQQFKRNCKGYLVDGNNSPVAKFSVFEMPERTMKACRVCRIS